jgi:broad specificity phosphatase PhoE
MFAARVPTAEGNNEKSSWLKRKLLKRYNHVNPDYRVPPNVDQRTQYNYDLRLIILRHAERVDQALGQDWYDQVFGGAPSAPPQAYKHPSLPQKLPPRANTLLYVFDPPITRAGEQQSVYKGQQLGRVGAFADYCYSSPASRSVITANAILKGMNRSHVPIRLEPYLFEPMNWNSALSLLGQMNPFMSSTDWRTTGYNIDMRYHRLNNYINTNENETGYYTRTRNVFDAIERHHGDSNGRAQHGQTPKRRTTILIVGHASSTEMFSTIALRQPFDTKELVDQSAKVPYLHTAVLERDAYTRAWYLRSVLL